MWWESGLKTECWPTEIFNIDNNKSMMQELVFLDQDEDIELPSVKNTPVDENTALDNFVPEALELMVTSPELPELVTFIFSINI